MLGSTAGGTVSSVAGSFTSVAGSFTSGGMSPSTGGTGETSGGMPMSGGMDQGGMTTAAGTGGSGGDGGLSNGGAGGTGSVTTGDNRSGPFKMLVFSWTTGFHHDSIPAAQQMAREIGMSNPIAPFTVDIANAQPTDPTGSCTDNGQNDPNGKQLPIPGCVANVGMFTDDNLKNYEIVYFANPTGNDFSQSGAVGQVAMAAFEKYMRNGGAYIGTHSATDFEKGNGGWAFYSDLLGALFDHHDGDGTPGSVVIQDAAVNHPVVRGLPKVYSTQDEWYYQLRNPEGRDGITILAKLSTDQRPVIWTHEYDGGGRMIYTIRGHNMSRYQEPWFRQLFLQGVMWAVHRLK
jgi:type 1 glutamine amidotransferase